MALDPLPASTQASSQGAAPSPLPVALQPPLAVETAFEALRGLFDALTREDLSPLPSLLTERSTWVNLPNHTSVPLQTHLRERMRRLDYLQLAGQTLVREAEAEVYTHDDLATMMVGRPARPGEMAPTDLLLRVRVLIPRVGADRLFGDTLLLVVRPDQGRYRIHSLQEDFQIP